MNAESAIERRAGMARRSTRHRAAEDRPAFGLLIPAASRRGEEAFLSPCAPAGLPLERVVPPCAAIAVAIRPRVEVSAPRERSASTGMILEGLVTTLDSSGRLNVAPMGPIVDESMDRLILRPFRTSQTHRNLKLRPEGVFHVTDDVLLLARAAIRRLDETPETYPAERVAGRVLASACRWYEFTIDDFDDRQERATLAARVIHRGRLRDFFGFHRARHAVLEAAILATRLHLLPRNEVLAEFARLRVPLEKTAGPREREAFELLEKYVEEQAT